VSLRVLFLLPSVPDFERGADRPLWHLLGQFNAPSCHGWGRTASCRQDCSNSGGASIISFPCPVWRQWVAAGPSGGIPEIAIHGQPKWLPSQESAGFVATTVQRLGANLELLIDIGRNARERSASMFTLERLYESWSYLCACRIYAWSAAFD
jgi:hypothetical protein